MKKQLKFMVGLFAILMVTLTTAGLAYAETAEDYMAVATVVATIAVGPVASTKTPEEMAAAISESIKDIKQMVEKSATVEALNAAIAEFNTFKDGADLEGHKTKISDLEKTIRKLTDKVGKISITGYPGGASLAARIKEAFSTDVWKKHLENRAEGESPIYALKDINWGAAGGEGVNDVVPNAMPFVIPQYPFEEPFDVRSYVPVGTVDSGSLDYPKEKLYTDGMGVEAETGLSDETTITFEMVTETAHRIATFAEVSRRALRNTAWLSQYLANRFMEKFIKLLNTQVLVGNGTGENLNGIITQASAFPAAGAFTDTIPTGESTLIDAVIAMKSALYNTANVMANACFVSPVTHYQLTVQKTTTREYAYDGVLAQVDENGVWKLNGMVLIMSKDVPDGDALIGLISPNVLQVLMNGGIDMATSQSHSTNFAASLVAFRFEADVLFPIYRPYAFMTDTLATVQADITA